MKKLFNVFAMLFACTFSISAQKTIPGSWNVVPSMFTYDHKPYVISYDAPQSDPSVLEPKDVQVQILDYDLNSVFSSEINVSTLNRLEYIQYEENGFEDGSDYLYFTQTLFNDDEDWEYVDDYAEIDGNWTITKELYRVKKLSGELLYEIDLLKHRLWFSSVYVLGDKCYVEVQSDPTGDLFITYQTRKYYTIPEFRKLLAELSEGETRITAQPAFECHGSGVMYDLSGKEVTDSHKGIVIKDGKKFLMK